jgi:general secretion pathway protein H
MRRPGFRPAVRSAHRDASGFSLLELLVVLLIIGLMTSAALLSVSIGENDPARAAALRLKSLIGLAHEEAQMQGRNLALGLWQRGWRFYELGSDGHWQPVQDERSLRTHNLTGDLVLKLQLQGIDVVLSPLDKTRPQVFLLSSGEMQPFVIDVEQQGSVRERLHGDALGQLTLSTTHHAP